MCAGGGGVYQLKNPYFLFNLTLGPMKMEKLQMENKCRDGISGVVIQYLVFGTCLEKSLQRQNLGFCDKNALYPF